jgi:hypothetical protein
MIPFVILARTEESLTVNLKYGRSVMFLTDFIALPEERAITSNSLRVVQSRILILQTKYRRC